MTYNIPKGLIITPSGMRGETGKTLNLEVIIRFTKCFGKWLGKNTKVIVGRDTRSTSEMISMSAVSALIAMGIDVIDVGVCPTPIIIYYKRKYSIEGAIIVSGSHNPPNYNGLKYLSRTDTFLGLEELDEVNEFFVKSNNINDLLWDQIGTYKKSEIIDEYIDDLIKSQDTFIQENNKIKIVVDPNAGAGSGVTSKILEKLGFEVIEINEKFLNYPSFPRPIEPIKPHLMDLSNKIKETNAEVGFAHDCDADRIAIVNKDGTIYPEDITVAIIIKYLLQKNKSENEVFGKPLLVTNSASSLMFEKIAEKFGGNVIRTPIGERYLAMELKELQKKYPDHYVFGGEGSSGGFMYPQFNNARDGIYAAIKISEIIASTGKGLAQLVDELPEFYRIREKIQIEGFDVEIVLNNLKKHLIKQKDKFSIIDRDIKILHHEKDEWILVHPSNTEPIIRIITEATTESRANELCKQMKELLDNFMKD